MPLPHDLHFLEDPSPYAVAVFCACCDAIGLPRNAVTLFSYAGSGTAWASVLNQPFVDHRGRQWLMGDRIIAYDPVWFTSIESICASPWRTIYIIAHEVGHHQAFVHNAAELPGAWEHEQAATYYAGMILATMGAGLHDIQVCRIDFPNNLIKWGTPTHPPTAEHDRAVLLGWKNGGGPSNPVRSMPRFFDPTPQWWP